VGNSVKKTWARWLEYQDQNIAVTTTARPPSKD